MRTISLLITAVTLAGSACDSTAGRPVREPAAIESPVAPSIVKVDEPNLVCMVNDQYMGVPQIPVEVGGKVYFGCCPACRDRLMTDPSLRAARDPVSHAAVDKAMAVIARRPDGKLLYFANEDNLRNYRP